MPINQEALLGLIGSIYDAISHPDDGWTNVLNGIQEAIGASHGMMYGASTVTNPALWVYVSTLSLMELEGALRGHCAAVDPLTEALKVLPPENAYTIYCQVGKSNFNRSEYRNDFWSIHSLGDSVGCVFVRKNERMGIMGFPRDAQYTPYGDAEVRTVQTLIPHIKRAFLLQERITLAAEREQSMVDTLDQMPYGILLLGGTGRVLMANAAARAILADSHELTLRQGHLSARNGPTDCDLRRLIGLVVATGAGNGTHPGASLLVPQDPPRHPLAIQVNPFRHAGLTLELRNGVAGVVFLSSLGTAMSDRTTLLRQFYNLSASEARVAQEVANGATIDEIADRARLSRETIRTQLKGVYAKIGIRHQAELVRMLLIGLPPGIDRKVALGEPVTPPPPATPHDTPRTSRSGPPGAA